MLFMCFCVACFSLLWFSNACVPYLISHLYFVPFVLYLYVPVQLCVAVVLNIMLEGWKL